ncbi:DUF2339 domain-containing protein [Microvirga flavescens]|uniref:DUF2339 domain-containing protein n=1 Tax=Microvirga flavescens TaxID=2249811 RepID=UPI001FE2240B|nr:DUF2339 domain-containing protein [Microvirga flavescens]
MTFLFVALLVLAIPICAVGGLVIALSQRKRLDFLQQRVTMLESLLAKSPAPQPAPAPEPAPQKPAPEAPVAAPGSTPLPSKPSVPLVAAAPRSTATATAKVDIEERIGSRWAVWVGGVALALGGIFLVRYSIEQDLLGPKARTASGLLFAALLLGAGEWLRRREKPLSLPGFDTANVPAILTAAGTSTAFATTYAAYGLYDLISPATAFVVLGLVAALTMLAALLHGPALAALGLVAALGAPLLVSSDAPQPWALVIYLAFAVVAAYGVARLRLWRWLALSGAVGALVWTLPIFFMKHGEIIPAMAHLVLQIGLAGLFLVADAHRADPERTIIDRFASVVLFAFALASVLVSGSVHAGDGRIVFAGLVVLMLAALGLRYSPAAPAVASAAFAIVGILTVWPIRREISADPQSVFYYGDFDLFAMRPDALVHYLTVAAVFSLGLAGACLWRVARARMSAPIAAWHAGAASVGPLLVLAVAWWRVAALERSLSFTLAAGLLACLFVVATVWLRKREADDADDIRLGVGAVASAALAALSLGLIFALDKGMLTVAFALSALGAAIVAVRAGIPALRYAIAAIGVVVLGRLAWDPTIVGGAVGGTIIFNWLLVGYGVPALAFFQASRLLERQGGRGRIVRFIESLAIVFAAFLVFFEIRHAVQSGDILKPATGFLELGLLATSSFAFSLLLARTDAARPDAVYRYGALAFKAISLAIAIGGLLIGQNPLLTNEAIAGGAFFNTLIPAYLLPAILALLLARQEKGTRPPVYALISAVLGLALFSAFLMLEIRCAFQGPYIAHWRGTGQSEQWAYSIALLGCGMVLLALGLLKDIRFARMASAVYLLLAVFKVFIIDLANMEGVMRALSFIGLGLVLIGIGLVYQKLLAQRPLGD